MIGLGSDKNCIKDLKSVYVNFYWRELVKIWISSFLRKKFKPPFHRVFNIRPHEQTERCCGRMRNWKYYKSVKELENDSKSLLPLHCFEMIPNEHYRVSQKSFLQKSKWSGVEGSFKSEWMLTAASFYSLVKRAQADHFDFYYKLALGHPVLFDSVALSVVSSILCMLCSFS